MSDIPYDLVAQHKRLSSLLAELKTVDSERAEEIRRLIHLDISLFPELETQYINIMVEKLGEQYGEQD